MKVRGITCGNTRRTVEGALNDPRWVYDGVAGKGHGRLRWMPTNEVVVFSLTPSDRNSWRNTARDIERISGVRPVPKGNRKPGRMKVSRADMLARQRADRDRQRIIERREAGIRQAAAEYVRRTDAKFRKVLDGMVSDAIAQRDAQRREIESLMRPGRVVL